MNLVRPNRLSFLNGRGKLFSLTSRLMSNIKNYFIFSEIPSFNFIVTGLVPRPSAPRLGKLIAYEMSYLQNIENLLVAILLL